jgi:ACS family hexuronate transporter-like MFS transporter
VFLACALLTLLSLVTALLPAGPLLLGVLLVMAFGSLGLYPPYYSFSQELTIRHQGKVNGSLAGLTWLAMAVMHPLVGRWIDQTRDYASAMAVAGLAPLVGVGALFLFWGKAQQPLAISPARREPEPTLADSSVSQPAPDRLPR